MREGWLQTALGDVCDLTKGATPTMKARPGPYPLVVTAEDRATSDAFQFDTEAVCIPMVSSTGHGHASLKRVHYESGKFAVANILVACTAKAGAPVLMRYMWLLLDHSRDQLLVPLMKGTANVALSQRALAAVSLVLPPLREQRRIVDLIGALDDTRAAAQAALSASPYRQMLKALGDLYEPERLEDVVDRAFAGGTPSRQVGSYFDGRIPWLKSGEVENDHIVDSAEHINDVAMRSSSARLVPSGATVVAMYGQGDTKGRAGFVEAPVTTNQAVLALIPNVDRIHSRFLLHAVRSRTESLRSRAVGAAQPNLSKSLVLAETVPVPQDLGDQRRWADLLDAVRRVESDTQDEHLRLQAARSSLLTALLSGEHEIPESYDELMGAVS